MRNYLILLTLATLAIAPFPTGRSVSLPLDPAPIPADAPPAPAMPPAAQHTRHTVIGYNRSQAFGPGWAQLPGGCDTRSAAMAAAWHADCTAPWATWDAAPIRDPYTGNAITPGDVELDHLLPLAAAWDLGAYAWPKEKRLAFANDPANLVVTSSAANQQKSDQLPAEWLPPDWRARCAYAEGIAHVAKHYALTLPADDRRAMRRACSGMAGLAARRNL